MFHFIYNPIAGKGKSQRFRKAIEARLDAAKVAHRFHETAGRGDATRIARELTQSAAEGDFDIVAMGGDGTLNEVLNGIDDPSRTRLGIIPCGSGNDFAAAARIPDSPEGSVELLLNGTAKPTDYLECSGIRGINAIGAGIDVDILRRYSRMKLLKGSAAYLASLVTTLFTFSSYRFREVTEEGFKPHNALIACVGNGQSIGGGIPICPEASIDDGLMDVVVVDDIPRPKIPGAFVRLMQKRILELPTASFHRATRFAIQSDLPMPVQIDGEIHESLPFDVRIVPGLLRVYRP